MKKIFFLSGWLAFLILAALFVGSQAAAQGGGGAYLRLWHDDGTVQEFECAEVAVEPPPTLEPGETATPLPTVLPSQTPAPTATPSPTFTPVPLCWGTVLVDGLNVRSAPWGAVVTTYSAGTRIGIEGGVYDTKSPPNLWYKLIAPDPLYVYATLIKLGDGTQCNLPSAPRSIRAGPHILGGEGAGVAAQYPQAIQVVKCIVDFSLAECRSIKAANPKVMIIYRTLNVQGGMFDCPEAWQYANGDPSTWYARIKPYLPTGGDAYEIQNECPPPPGGYSVWAQWSIGLAQLIQRDFNAPMLAFSFGPGNPDYPHWVALLPYLEWAAANPLPDGRYHGVAVHSSVYMSGQPRAGATWINDVHLAGRETEIARKLIAQTGFDLARWPGLWVITEAGLDDGYSGLWGADWTCGELRDAYQTSIKTWSEQGVVDAVTWWNVGKIGRWSSNHLCWGEMVK